MPVSNTLSLKNPDTTFTIGPEWLFQHWESKVTQVSRPTTVLYTHPDCAYSAAAKMDYRKRKIAYLEIDVSKQMDKIPELEKLTGGERVTPVIVENGKVTIGFKGGT